MALLLILFGVLLAGVLADFLVENDVATAASQPLTMAGVTVELSTPVVAAIAFAMGALAVLLIVAGIRRMRRTRRKHLEARIAQLEDENARLVTRRNLPNVIKIPDSEPVAWSSDATPSSGATQTQGTIPPPPVATTQESGQQPAGGSSASRW